MFYEQLQRGVGRIAHQHTEELGEVESVCAVDVAYKGRRSAAAAVVWNLPRGEAVETKTHKAYPPSPYVPGLLFLREAPAMLRAVNKLTTPWQLLLVDAHGRAHPREAGLATFLGLCVGRPTLGVAKRLLVGSPTLFEGPFAQVVDAGRVVGYAVRQDKRTYYVSQGYLVPFEAIPDIVKMWGISYPEALRAAHHASTQALATNQ